MARKYPNVGSRYADVAEQLHDLVKDQLRYTLREGWQVRAEDGSWVRDRWRTGRRHQILMDVIRELGAQDPARWNLVPWTRKPASFWLYLIKQVFKEHPDFYS